MAALTDEDTVLPLSVLCGISISKEGWETQNLLLPALIVAYACDASTRAEEVVAAFIAKAVRPSMALRTLKKLLKSGNVETALILNLQEEDHGIDP